MWNPKHSVFVSILYLRDIIRNDVFMRISHSRWKIKILQTITCELMAHYL